jgi:hypothetical protein
MSEQSEIANRVYWKAEKTAEDIFKAILERIQEEQRELAIAVNAKILHEKRSRWQRIWNHRDGRAKRNKVKDLEAKIANLGKWMTFASSFPDHESLELTFADFAYFFVGNVGQYEKECES